MAFLSLLFAANGSYDNAASAIDGFEELGQSSGLVLYEAEPLLPAGTHELTVTGLHDRAQVFVDGAPVAVLDRETSSCTVAGSGRRVLLELLVENQGRINYGPLLGQGKGILGGVRVERRLVHGWTMRGLPLDEWTPEDVARATSSARPGGTTGLEATYPPIGSGYSQRNFCDLSGVWVDPDTGDWYGLVHNEFTRSRSATASTTTPSTTRSPRTRAGRGPSRAMSSPPRTAPSGVTTPPSPHQTYHYGDGDQRLFVDTASGYFYVYYGSRIVEKGGRWKVFHGHVARAPISAKMAPGSWRKWYDGSWFEPGVGGKESNMVPVDSANGTGYTPPSTEYDPANTGTVSEQVAAGTASPASASPATRPTSSTTSPSPPALPRPRTRARSPQPCPASASR